MNFIEGCEYAKIKTNSVVVYDGQPGDWMPEDARTKHDVILREMYDKYLDMTFKIVSPKPYPVRRRVKIRGVFWDESMYAGLRNIEAWKDDLIFFIYMEGMLVPLIAPKPKKVKVAKESPVLGLGYDIVSDIESITFDDVRDEEAE